MENGNFGMELKNGYKRTEVGNIPKDWEVKRLFEVVQFENGKAHEDFISDNGKYIVVNSKFVSTKGKVCKYSNKNLSPLKIGDIAMVMSDIPNGKALAKCFLVNKNETYTLNQRICSLKSINANNKFLFYVINRNKYFLQFDSGVGQTNLRKDEVLECPLPLPPLAEQKKIAEILSTWDKAIETTEKLLTAKQTRKRAVQQRLLTGKQRFPQFRGQAWCEVRLGEVFREIKDTNDGGNSHSIMTISSRLGLISQEDKFDRVIAGDSLKKYTQLKREDFAYNKGNSKSYQMGCIYQLEDKESALVPFVYICFRPTDEVCSTFYKHWFLAHGLDGQLKKIITSGARGDGLLNVNTEDFFKLKIPFPPKEEQKRIAEILSACDKEINLLENGREALKNQKRGLMQILLTGRARVNVEEN